MYARRLSSIVQMKVKDRIAVIGEGLPLIAQNALAYERDALLMGQTHRNRSGAVLHGYALEEAAKVVILLDLARGGLGRADLVQKCVKDFYNHLARGIYAEVYDSNLADLVEARGFTEMFRQQLYLDGPMDVDWIFANEITTKREDRMYVDFIEREGQQREWTSPLRETGVGLDEPRPTRHQLLVLLDAFERLGMLSARGVEATMDAWAGTTTDDNTSWSDIFQRNADTIDRLKAPGQVLTEMHEAAIDFVADRWAVPLFPLDLFELKVKVDDLLEQREWRLAQEYGQVYGD